MKRAIVSLSVLPALLLVGCSRAHSSNGDRPIRTVSAPLTTSSEADGTTSAGAATSDTADGGNDGDGANPAHGSGSDDKGAYDANGRDPVTASYGCHEATFTNNTKRSVRVTYGQANAGGEDVLIRPGKSHTVHDMQANPFGWSVKSANFKIDVMTGPQNIDLSQDCHEGPNSPDPNQQQDQGQQQDQPDDQGQQPEPSAP